MDESKQKSERTSAVLLAAGQSTRMGSEAGALRKPFMVVEGLTLLEHACAAFDRARAVVEIVIVGHPDDHARLEQMAKRCPSMRKVRAVRNGGELRTDSVRAGVAACDRTCTLVAIHDVARPLIETRTIELAIQCADKSGAAVVAVPMRDTVKTSSDGAHTETTLDRSVLWNAQTPQVFGRRLFEGLLEEARTENFRPTDDAALHERYKGPVKIVLGSVQNLKVTTPEDLLIAAAILRARRGTLAT